MSCDRDVNHLVIQWQVFPEEDRAILKTFQVTIEIEGETSEKYNIKNRRDIVVHTVSIFFPNRELSYH